MMDTTIRQKAGEQITRIKQSLKNFQQNIRQMSRKKLMFLIIMIMSLSAAGAMIPSHFIVVLSPSVNHRIFYFKHSFQQSDLKEGTYVMFDIYTKLHKNCRPCSVVKRIACDEGDVLKISQRNYYCNNRYIGTAKMYSKSGIPLKEFNYHGKIPSGKIFAAGSCIDSYDSRYFGFVDKKNVKAIAIPII